MMWTRSNGVAKDWQEQKGSGNDRSSNSVQQRSLVCNPVQQLPTACYRVIKGSPKKDGYQEPRQRIHCKMASPTIETSQPASRTNSDGDTFGSASPSSSRSLKIPRLAPLQVPWERRKQTAAVLAWTLFQPFFMAPICFGLLVLLLLNPLLVPLTVAYLVWYLFFGTSHAALAAAGYAFTLTCAAARAV